MLLLKQLLDNRDTKLSLYIHKHTLCSSSFCSPLHSKPSSPSFNIPSDLSSVAMNGDSYHSAHRKPGQSAGIRVPVYSKDQIVEKLQLKWNAVKEQPYPAMYSSYFGGIILDPSMMVIPIDDHMVHRGHGVFDTAVLLNGYLYELDTHLDRFLKSASKAKISSPFPKETLKSILIQMTAASKYRKGSLRFWLSAGPGDFLLSSSGCPEPVFYAVVIADDFSQRKKGVKVVTATTPMKPPIFATMKNVNYLPNVLAILEAEEKGAFSSVWVDKNGHIAEGPNVNVAFISKKKELLLPTFENILTGCTAKRLLALAPKLVEKGLLKGVENRNITVEEAKNSAEMMYVGSTLPLLPIIEWDGKPVGNGKVGELTLALSDLLWNDMTTGPERIRVPYEDNGKLQRSNL